MKWISTPISLGENFLFSKERSLRSSNWYVTYEQKIIWCKNTLLWWQKIIKIFWLKKTFKKFNKTKLPKKMIGSHFDLSTSATMEFEILATSKWSHQYYPMKSACRNKNKAAFEMIRRLFSSLISVFSTQAREKKTRKK